MCCGSAVFISNLPAQRTKELVEIAGAGNDNSNVYDTKIKEKPEVIQVSIKEWVFVIPLNLKANLTFEAIHFMRWRIAL